jgi:AbrB family looped-hinge helix DNA binding protein
MRRVATMTSKGQVTLPAELRRELRLKPGDKVAFERQPDGRVYIDAGMGTLADLRGLIQLDRRVSDEEIDGWIEEARGRKAGRTSGE